MEIADLMTRGIAVILMVYLFFAFVRVVRASWRWLKGRSITGAARTAGVVAGKMERAAASAADAFKQGRGR